MSPMHAPSDESKADLRLPSHDLEQLRESARQCNADVAGLGRAAIRAYLDTQDPQNMRSSPTRCVRQGANKAIAAA